MNQISTAQLESFKNFINSHDFFYIAGHKEPDGDCIASSLGLSSLLKKLNKEHKLINAGPFKRVELKKYADLFFTETEFMLDEERKRTGLIICDCSEVKRLGEIDGDLSGLDTFVIDHHKTSVGVDNGNSIIDSTCPAASILVQLLYENIVGELPKETAEILYFGTMTDTGFFRFLTEKDADVLVHISRLLKAGANPRTTYDYITSGKAYSTRKLLGVMLDHAEQYLDGRLIVTYENLNDTRKWGQEGRDSDALYSAMLSVENVEAVAFLRQDTEGTCTGGLRSKDKVDVSVVATKFGGGGHKNASGFSTDGKLETLIPAVIKEFSKIM